MLFRTFVCILVRFCSSAFFRTLFRTLVPSFAHSFARLFARLLIRSLVYSSACLLAGWLACLLVRSLVRSLVYSYACSSARLFTRSFAFVKKMAFIKFSLHSSSPRLSSRFSSSVVLIPVPQLFAISSTLSPCF